ncbi:MAG: EF-P lysine aminoacylase GenX [Fibrobacteria bacterium]|nr:EF-P lysine aminoacylase GenX [Fibrobacteria bacterium]
MQVKSGAWRPTATLEALAFRARCARSVREFFHAREVLEVETPLLSEVGTVDLWIDSFEVRSAISRESLWLQTSPEFHMKRLLAAGSGPIWQMTRAFRDEGRGRLHNPEFSIVEWYRPGWTLRELCEEVEALCRCVAPEMPAARWMSYQEAFVRRAGVDPFGDPVDKIRQAAEEACVVAPPIAHSDRDGWLDLLLVSKVEPGLGDEAPVFLWGYPPSRAALARIEEGPPRIALRAELYWKGVELCNAYDELVDASEQRERFQEESRARNLLSKPTPPIDHGLVAALEQGMPASAGVALGFDRLVQIAYGAREISEVIAFAEG